PKNPHEEFTEAAPESVRDAVAMVYRHRGRLQEVNERMVSGFAAKTVDSFYLPAAVAVIIACWAFGAFAMKAEPLVPWMMAGIPVAGVVGFTVFAALQIPLRRSTRLLHPLSERILRSAEAATKQAKNISTRVAKETSRDLVQRRKDHVAEARRWQTEQIAEVDAQIQAEHAQQHSLLTARLEEANQHFQSGFATLQATMRERADLTANQIQQKLSASDQSAGQLRMTAQQRRQEALHRLSRRLQAGLQRGLQRIANANELTQYRYPAWHEVVDAPLSDRAVVDWLPLGSVPLGGPFRAQLDAALVEQHEGQPPTEHELASVQVNGAMRHDFFRELAVPHAMPVAIHRRRHSAVMIEVPNAHLNAGVDVAHQLLWRLLSAARPGRTKVTLLDSIGRGQNFAGFMALADHDPSMIHHRVWTTGEQIATRLSELTHHVEDVLQASLRDAFERIEDYNAVAGALAEPYHAVAAVGFPEGLSRDAYSNLMSLIRSGRRCGVLVVMVVEKGKPWPSDLPEPSGDDVLHLSLDAIADDRGEKQLRWHCNTGLGAWGFQPGPAPTPEIRGALARRLGKASLEAGRVIVPLRDLLAEQQLDDESEPNTDHGIEVLIGSQGAGRQSRLKLGEGVRQHVVIAGKTGSGKSTLLHDIITAGASRYTPDQLQFYLLDFKKGVEFKVYADAALPHVRVVGIESEREFGRSVLQRLDAELTRRGELFRAASVQEVADFRQQRRDEPMPRLMLLIDEFQELFTRDDALAADCTALLDRLVRQGRSFGIHVILSSQSLAGANSLPRATLGQMAVRIALQCGESDAALILSDDNTAAKLLQRPGEAIYNDAGGLVEGNHPFQVAWMTAEDQEIMLTEIHQRDVDHLRSLAPMIVFEGNRPAKFHGVLAQQALDAASPADRIVGLLGESVQLGPPTVLSLAGSSGRNALVVAPPRARIGLLGSIISVAIRHQPALKLNLFDGSRADEGKPIREWLEACCIPHHAIKPRDVEAETRMLADEVKRRLDLLKSAEDPDAVDLGEPVLLVVDSLERLRDLRQDDSFSFSLDSAGGDSAPVAFQTVLREGPTVNVHVIVVVSNAETLGRFLPRQSQHDLEIRIVGQLSAADSSLMIDSPNAAELAPATMILYDEADGRTTKFRPCDTPEPDVIRDWLAQDAQPISASNALAANQPTSD
ncbi:MAG: FtsK/SpoIIIE domain-containing protein, partial [Planctomycetota bacterium]